METEKPDSGEKPLPGSLIENLRFADRAMTIQKGVLCSDAFLVHKRPEIAGYFKAEKDDELQTDYLRNSFRMGMKFVEGIEGLLAEYHAEEDGLHIKDVTDNREGEEVVLSWDDARYFVNSYIEEGTYLRPGEKAENIEKNGMYRQLDLFTMFSMQTGSIAMKQAEQGIERGNEAQKKEEIPKEQIDTILRSGGGRENSRKRIYAKYQQGKTPEEMAEFIKKEYGTTGKGFEFDGKQVSVWFDEQGMTVGSGTSALTNPKLKMNWSEIEQHIRTQVENGTYMGANESYLVDEVERERIANYAAYFFYDGMGEMPEEIMQKIGSRSDAHDNMVALVSSPEGIKLVAEQMDKAMAQLESGEKKLRFRSVMPKEELRAELDNLLVEKRIFPTPDTVEVKKEDFITQDEIDYRLCRGSSFQHGLFRIYDYFMEGHSREEAVKFLKNEYGTGGSSSALAGADNSYEDHSAKGIKLEKGSIGEPYAKVLLPWKVVEKRIRKLIEEDKYLSPEAKEDYAEYKREEAQQELEKAQKEIENAQSELKTEEPERVTIDGFECIKTDEWQNGNNVYVIGNAVNDRDFFYAEVNGNVNFEYDHEPDREEVEEYYLNYEAEREIDRHEAEVFSRIEGGEEPETKYSVTETSDAFAAGEDFAVWDNEKGEYYREIDGTVHTFATIEEAENYLKQVEQGNTERKTGEKETGEWLPVEGIELPFDEPGKETSGHDVQKPELLKSEPETLKPEPELTVEKAHNFHITDDSLGKGGAKEKFKRNIEAVRTLKTIENENRAATPEEQEILSQYVGWGGLADAFDETKSSWSSEYQELKNLLSDDEYMSARESTLNSHYTSPTIIRNIYDTLERMGFEKGNVLEPAMGIGNFFGMLPEAMKDSRLYGVELDSISGRIAKQLYPEADINIKGFEKTEFPNDFFDVAVGNVPFGQYKVPDRQYDKKNFLIHDYFFAKALDKVRPGGIVAFVTSKGTMDKKSPEVRKYLAQRAELLGAVRLPNTAFKENAGTEVTSDILFLKKRDRIMDLEPDWVHLSEDGNGIAMNDYFVQHPEMVVGKMEMVTGPYGMESTCQPDNAKPFEEQLREALSRIEGNIEEAELGEISDGMEEQTIPADPNIRNYSYTVVDDKVYYRENSIMKSVEMQDSMLERIKGMIAIRECTQELIKIQLEEYPESAIKEKQAELNSLYDSFSRKYGLINSQSNKRAFNQDSSYCLLCSLEKLDDEGKFKGKADMFSRRTIKKAEV